MTASTPSPRLFIVGCARSGTTILQSCVGAHPGLFTFPESRLMRTTRGRRPMAARLGLASRVAQPLLRKIYEELGLNPAECLHHVFQAGYVRDFVRAVDRACLAAGKGGWLEKTPDHVRDTDRLTRWVPGAKFIHILRGGYDNVCSLLDVSRRHASWSTRPVTLEECIARWSGDVEASLACLGRPGHCLVRHSDLVENPAAVIRTVDRFAGLDFHPEQLAGLALEQIASVTEPWKKGVSGGVSRPDPDKYHDLLSRAERDHLMGAVASLQARIDALPAG